MFCCHDNVADAARVPCELDGSVIRMIRKPFTKMANSANFDCGPQALAALHCFRFSESESKIEVARDMFFDAVTIPTAGDFDDDEENSETDSVGEGNRLAAVSRLRFTDADFPSVLVTLGVVNAASWAPFFVLLLAEPLLG